MGHMAIRTMYWPCGAFECETAHTTTNFLHENGTSPPLKARAEERPLFAGVKQTWPFAEVRFRGRYWG